MPRTRGPLRPERDCDPGAQLETQSWRGSDCARPVGLRTGLDQGARGRSGPHTAPLKGRRRRVPRSPWRTGRRPVAWGRAGGPWHGRPRGAAPHACPIGSGATSLSLPVARPTPSARRLLLPAARTHSSWREHLEIPFPPPRHMPSDAQCLLQTGTQGASASGGRGGCQTRRSWAPPHTH